MTSEFSQSNTKNLENLSDEELNQLDMGALLQLDEQTDDVVGRGEVITGTVVQVDDQFIYLDYGQKVEGRVPREEVSAEVNINDQYNAIVMKSESGDGFSVLSIVEANKKMAWDRLTADEDIENMIVEGRIDRIVNGGYIVDVSGLRFFLPGSQMGEIRIKDQSEIIGQVLDFKILKLDDKRKSGVLSRRQLLDDRQKEKWSDFLKKYHVGDRVVGSIKGITEYGVFIEVDEVKGLLHVSDMSWKKNVRPKDMVKKNDDIEVEILKIEEEAQRVAFGLKQMQEDPWILFIRENQVGDQLKGVVTQLVPYGAFIEVAEGIEGLIHVSELSWSRRINHPKQVVKKGDEVNVSILKIDEEERKLSLSLKAVLENPWEKVAQNHHVGDIMKGVVTTITNFGAFVTIDEDVEGLIHISDLSWDDVEHAKDMVNKGDEIEFKIMEIVPEERKISCSVKHLNPSPWELLRKKYPKNSEVDGKVTGIVPFGVFIELEENVEGLVHISQISKQRIEDISEKYKKGDQVHAIVLGVDVAKKRISLSIKELDKIRERKTIDEYMTEPSQSQRMTLGDLVDINQM